MSEVTRILAQVESDDPAAAEQLLPLVYDELRKLAAARLAQEKPGQTLQATALVHEAYLRLVGPPDGENERRSEGETEQNDDPSVSLSLRLSVPAFHSRGHFFAAAAEAMRRILVDEARKKQSAKRGGDRQRIDLELVDPAQTPAGEELLAFHDALGALEQHDAEAARLVKLRYFLGLSVEEAGAALSLPRSTAYDHWNFARAWLRRQLRS